MMLRASIDAEPSSTAEDQIADGLKTTRVGDLEDFVAAVVAGDGARSDDARSVLVDRYGTDWMVDASAVIATFEMMTRLADATGARLRPEEPATVKVT